METTESSSPSPSSPFAYVFMAFGCDPGDVGNRNVTHKPGYRPYIANMLVAAELLRRKGTKADIVAMFKFANPHLHSTLPPTDQAMLQAMNIQIRYIPPTPKWQSAENKHFTVRILNKIHILNLTEYRRVLFLDGDVLPLANLDYLMELSDRGEWQETVILSTSLVPMIAGLFVATPNAALFRQVYRMVDKMIVKNRVPKNHFDVVQGWGHAWDPQTDGPYLWQSNRDKGTLWDYYAANGDQGILYYYPRYMRESLTQILAGEILHFGKNNSQWKTPSLPPTTSVPFEVPNCHRWTNNHSAGCLPPYSDHAHFTHPLAKPWQLDVLPPRLQGPDKEEPRSALDLWWQTLYRLCDEHAAIQLESLFPDLVAASKTL
jgi:alpha-N-acetylglucosamine transferase